MSVDPVVAGVLRAALALLILPAAWHKLRDLGAFRAALAEYELLPRAACAAAAPALAGAELATGALLLSPWARPWGFAAAAALLSLYSGAIAVNLWRGRRDIDCGCFGPARQARIGGALLARNGVWIAVAAAGGLPVAPRPLVWVDALTGVGTVVALGLVHASLDWLLAHAPRRPLRASAEAGSP